MDEETVVLNVTVRWGFGGVVLFTLLPPAMDDISGVVSEVDAIVVREMIAVVSQEPDNLEKTKGYHKQRQQLWPCHGVE